MMSGTVLHREVLEIETLPTEENIPSPISITIQIPDPLPMKRYPEPEVRTVDVVSPREEIEAYVIFYFFQTRRYSFFNKVDISGFSASW